MHQVNPLVEQKVEVERKVVLVIGWAVGKVEVERQVVWYHHAAAELRIWEWTYEVVWYHHAAAEMDHVPVASILPATTAEHHPPLGTVS